VQMRIIVQSPSRGREWPDGFLYQRVRDYWMHDDPSSWDIDGERASGVPVADIPARNATGRSLSSTR
jgi:hypothetical protein